MPETTISYNIATDCPNGINTSLLADYIRASNIAVSLKSVGVTGGTHTNDLYSTGTLNITFHDDPIQEDRDKIDGGTTNPAGGYLALAELQVETSVGDPNIREDGTLYAVPKPASFGYEMCDRDFKIVCGTVDAKAVHTVVNGANGSVTYAAARSGSHGNDQTITVEVGDTGAGHEDRVLAAVRTGNDVVVTFGTDGAGASVVPTALEVAALINGDLDLALYHLNAVPSGDGSGQVATVTQTNLAGGENPSCEDLKLNLDNLKEEGWGELSLVGVYKDNGGTMEECTDQSDADSFGILSVWDYTAFNPYTCDSMRYEMRDGYLVVDPSLPANERWDHRTYAIAAPLIPGTLGGQIRIFDGYLGPAPEGVIDAKSPQTVVMDPDKATGASTIRLHIFYPIGTKLSHVLRLVTYRKPGTF